MTLTSREIKEIREIREISENAKLLKLSKFLKFTTLHHPFCCQSAVDTTLNKKYLRRIVPISTAQQVFFISGSRYPRYHDKIDKIIDSLRILITPSPLPNQQRGE